ncbi:MAG: zinc-binding alcohol dehydrogenase [Paenibacillus sp.]|nr:zinc-binding alcohol dehydrogenase [Paenibacillus sp.]
MKMQQQTIARLGEAVIVERELPQPGEHQIVVKTEYSAISIGTETMVLRGNANGTALGYNAVGIVVDKGAGVRHLDIGQRVACYGGGSHADYRLASKYLASPVPDHVDPEEAAFVGLGAIAIHAVRQAELQFGETMVVVGLGILGQITAQIADAAAYRVIGFDIEASRCDLFRSTVRRAIGCSQVEQVAAALGEGPGADTVLLCGGHKSDQLLDQAIKWVRDRGSIVIVGVPNTSFNRNALFYKEAQIRISRAGGPGRYDDNYEQAGFDYPIGYVRWTEGRNVEQFVHLLAEKRLSVKKLIRHRFDFANIDQAYRLCMDTPEQTMGVLIRYDP